MATCDKLSEEQMSKVKNPPIVTYPLDPLTYGTEIQLNCSVEGGEDSVRSRTCLFDVAVGKYRLLGDSLQCGRESVFYLF